MAFPDRLPSIPSGRAFRSLLSATIISQLGDWSGRLAAALVVAERSDNSSLAVGAVGLVLAAPHVGPGQVLTATLERHGRRSVLVGCDVIRALAFLALATLPLGTTGFLILLAFASMADPPFEASASAAVVEITSKDELNDGIRIRQLTQQVSAMVGLGIAGLLVAWTSAEFVLAIDAASFLASAALIRSINDPLKHHVEKQRVKVRQMLTDGSAFLASDRLSRQAVLATLVVIIAGMGVEGQVAVLGPALAEAGPTGIGLMAMAAPIGTVLAVALLGGESGSRAFRRSIAMSCAAAAVAILLIEVTTSPVPLIGAFFAVGVIYQLSVTANITVAQRVPTERRATTFGLVQGVVTAAHGLGAWLGGVAILVFNAQRGAQAMLLLAALLLVIAPMRTDNYSSE